MVQTALTIVKKNNGRNETPEMKKQFSESVIKN